MATHNFIHLMSTTESTTNLNLRRSRRRDVTEVLCSRGAPGSFLLFTMVGNDSAVDAARDPSASDANGSDAQTGVSIPPASTDQQSSKALLDKLLPDGHTPGVVGDADFDMTSSDYYFNSYAHFGIHEEVRFRPYLQG